MLKPKFYEES
jgi:CRP-like cAMP-binding protein